MDKKALTILTIGLFCLWAINFVLVATINRNMELYPITAWSMFSGKPKTKAVSYTIEIYAKSNSKPIEINAQQMITSTPLEKSRTLRILRGIHKSFEYGCSGYQLYHYDKCHRQAGTAWILPKDIGQTWVQNAEKQLGIKEPPYSLSLIYYETRFWKVDNRYQTITSRKPIFTYKPQNGLAVLPASNKNGSP